jgi:hypothetical protein
MRSQRACARSSIDRSTATARRRSLLRAHAKEARTALEAGFDAGYATARALYEAAPRDIGAVPCHRVLGKDGSLRGHCWGHARKQKLLESESALPKDPSSIRHPPPTRRAHRT